MSINMNSILTTKFISNKNDFAGRQWFYNFRELPQYVDDVNLQEFIQSLSTRYSKITKLWDKDKNSEWLCRIYLSAKMIMTATLQLTALAYADEKNLRLVSPYLEYYSLLSLLRGIVYTIPEVEWNQGKLVEISHSKAINIECDHVSNFDIELASDLKAKILRAKAFRELISYRAPSSGDANIQSLNDLLVTATLLAEIAQFNSEIIESSIQKKADRQSFEFLNEYILDLTYINIENVNFFDEADHYRLDYLRRKYPVPPNILHIMTEGHVEDFFGAWTTKEEIDDVFDPDKNWQLIFDIP